MTGGTTFLVERYIPSLRPADIDLLAGRLAAATAQLRAEGREVYWLRSYALPTDEACLCVFAALTRADVEEANRRAESAYERILETHTFECDGNTAGDAGGTAARDAGSDNPA